MITKIQLHNFKIHKDLELKVGGLTLISGQNGMGKSSVFQSLLLLRQSCRVDGVMDGLNLKGDLAQLGVVRDVECQSAEDHNLTISIEQGSDSMVFEFILDVDSLKTFLPTLSGVPISGFAAKSSLFSDDFQYISAFRWGPRKGYERDTDVVERHRQISKMNGECEYAVHFLSHYGREECRPEMLLLSPGEEPNVANRLTDQVGRWMRLISPGVNVRVEATEESFKLRYNFDRPEQTKTSDMTPPNVGFGVTYALPIVVALLSARRGALIMIENPEAHIHPGAQAGLMMLVMRAVKAGVQVMIETHSDHIVNGALVAVAKEPVLREQVSVYYFDRDDRQHVSVAKELEVTADGRIRPQPEGFFDQMNKDLKVIMGF